MGVLLSTPSAGLNEVLTGLARVGGSGTATDLKRHYFRYRPTVADIGAVLTTLLGLSLVTNVGGRYTLTTTGIARARAKRSTRYSRYKG